MEVKYWIFKVKISSSILVIETEDEDQFVISWGRTFPIELSKTMREIK
jgi:hypothetical protein